MSKGSVQGKRERGIFLEPKIIYPGLGVLGDRGHVPDDSRRLSEADKVPCRRIGGKCRQLFI